ncbi:MAG: ABC transporter ATP-binding protein [Clostridiales bacterium]|nr:ABC transporter ATP-binding protein [Clostridiales bacterium]
MIRLEQVTKRYGSVQALKGVSLEVKKGEVLGLLGQNGAGKTTLLNILTGYLAPTGGRALIGGYDPLLESREAKRRLGYLPEHPPLYDEMTVREYLSFAAELKGVVRRAIPAHVDEVMALTGLSDMQNRLLSHLSKGYRQRAGFAQAMCGDPEVLVLDEPTVGLDPKQITEIRQLIQSLAKGRTIVFSSHILSEVQQLCTHVVILHDGLVRVDSPMATLGQGSETTLRLCAAADETRLLTAVKQLDGVCRIEAQPTAREGAAELLITFREVQEPERRLSALLSHLGAPILHLSRQGGSLEQIFLDAISGDAH